MSEKVCPERGLRWSEKPPHGRTFTVTMNYIEKPEIKEGGTAHFPTQTPLNDKIIMLKKNTEMKKRCSDNHSLTDSLNQSVNRSISPPHNQSVSQTFFS